VDDLSGLTPRFSGLNHPTFIVHIEVIITLDSLVTNLVSVNFDVSMGG
jgi:hypothetical protein